jgi:predicted deacylase
MVEISLSGSGEGPGWATAPGYSTAGFSATSGLPAVIYEAGGPLRFEGAEIAQGVDGVQRVMKRLAMIAQAPASPSQQRSFRKTRWVRTRTGGIFLTDLPLASEVARGQVLGTATDPLTDQREEIRAPAAGFLIGAAAPQVVMMGYALFHLGVRMRPLWRRRAGASSEVPQNLCGTSRSGLSEGR